MTGPDAFYTVLEAGRLNGDRYRGVWHSTERAGGAWQADEQHMGPVSGLLVHAVEESVRLRAAAGRGESQLAIGRIMLDILGLVTTGATEIVVEVLRPGRTIELLEAVITTASRPSVRGRIWRLAGFDSTEVAGGGPQPLPPPKSWPRWRSEVAWGGGYIGSIDGRQDPAAAPGRSRTWLRTEVDLVAGAESSDLARFVGLVDTANGVAVRQDPRSWMFPNLDLCIHLHRQPQWAWVGLDVQVIFGADGIGLTSATLFDLDGPVGRAEQILTVRRLA